MSHLPNVSYLQPTVDIYHWVKLLTAALICDAIGRHDSAINWDEVVVWSPDWMPSADSSPLACGAGDSNCGSESANKIAIRSAVLGARVVCLPKIIS
jgi:hypothetical protein